MIIAFICIVLIFNTMETISIHRPKIVVIGSCNTDMVVKANRLPVPGETILGGTFYMNPGGKGANQAIAPPDWELKSPSYPKSDMICSACKHWKYTDQRKLIRNIYLPTRKVRPELHLSP